MMQSTILTEDLGGSSLSRDARAGRLPAWYRQAPTGRDGWGDYLAEVARGARGTDWLGALEPALAPSGRAAERLRRASRNRGVIISTGQQAALFGGPLLTLIKALSALAFADILEREYGVVAAPVFWAATDDADFDEAREAHVPVRGGVRTLRLESRPPAGTPMSAAPIGSVASLIDRLADACGSIVDPAPLESVRTAYRPDRTIGDGFVLLMRAVLEPLGVAVLDASHPAVRRAAAPVLARALSRADEIERALRARADAIRAAGYSAQVDDVPDLSLVFRTEDGVKRRVPVQEARAVSDRSRPEQLSPNVLLRPLVERFIMPSAAYIAGPGELAYFAQVSAASEALAVPSPLVLPRWSATIIEPHIARILSRLDLQPVDLADPHAVETRLARAALPAGVTEPLEGLRAAINVYTDALRSPGADVLVPSRAIDGLRAALERRIARLERRYVASVKHREDQLMLDIATARGALFPDGVRQERRLSFVPFLTRGGQPLVDALRTAAVLHAGNAVRGVPPAPTQSTAPLAPHA